MADDLSNCHWCHRKAADGAVVTNSPHGKPICDECLRYFNTAKRPAWLAAEQWADLQEIARLVGMVSAKSQRQFFEQETVIPLAVRMRLMPDGSIGLEHWVPQIPALLARIRDVQARHPEKFQEQRNG